jgi:AcrR family transcriptional regulator
MAAAERVFADRGAAASTEEVARAAGVGVGTVFRHFPTKEALLRALIVERLRRLAADARDRAASPDAGEAFFDFFVAVVHGSGTKLELVDALAEMSVDGNAAVGPAAEEVIGEVTEAVTALLDRAQRAGTVRADIDVRDIIALLAGASQTSRYAVDTATRDRALAVVLDGLRARDAT